MRILTAHVENFRGWSQALLLVEEKGAKAFVSQSWDWEDREGDLFVLWPNSDFRGSKFDGGDTLADRLRAADGWDKLVSSQIEVLV
jgi:hypothetical protein